MARPVNTDLRLRITERHQALRKLHPFSTDLHEVLALEFGVSVRSVRYYLTSNRDGSKDARKRYTQEERAMIRSMSRKSLIAWAKSTGRNPNTVYALKMRLLKEVTEGYVSADNRKRYTEERGYFDFSDREDLRAYDLPVDCVAKAAKAIAQVLPKDSGIALVGPNFLFHSASKRHYCLTPAEQIALLSDPIRFLRFHSKTISAGWQGGEVAEYRLVGASAHGGEIILGGVRTLDEVGRIYRWFGRTLPAVKLRTDLIFEDGLDKLLEPKPEQADQAPLPKFSKKTGPIYREASTDPERLAAHTAILDELIHIDPDAPPPVHPTTPPVPVAPKLPPAPKVYRDGTNMPIHPKWVFRRGSEKEMKTLNSPDVDTAAAYYAGLEVDTLEELMAGFTPEDWLIVYDARGNIVDRTDNAPELGIGE